VPSTTASAMCDSILPVIRLRVTMPRALPSITIRSSISVRGNISTCRADLAFERLVGAQQQLLAGLAARVEGARNLRAAEGAVVEVAAVFARERHALRHALIDDVDADLRQAVDVGFAGAEIAALHGVVEEAVDAVAIVVIILGGVDAALRGDGVRAARRILEAEALDVVAQLPSVAAADPPARPEPTTMTVYLRLLAGFTSLRLKRVTFFEIGAGMNDADGEMQQVIDDEARKGWGRSNTWCARRNWRRCSFCARSLWGGRRCF
jgi:hypothetical protein